MSRAGFRREKRAHIAQLAEHALGKGEVTGSSPVVGSTIDANPNTIDLEDGTRRNRNG